MNFLSLKESTYSKKVENQPKDKTKVNLVISLVNRGLEMKEKSDLKDFSDGSQDEKQKEFLDKVLSSKPTNQDKAIISALLNKYPKLFSNEAQQRELREHLVNLLKVDKLTDSSLKYLLERLLSKETEQDKKKKSKEEEDAKAQEEQAQQNPEEGEMNPEEAEEQQGQQEPSQGQQAVETQNSDFYSDWEEEFNDTHTDLTEDDFSDLVDEDELDFLLRDINTSEDSEYTYVTDNHLMEKFILDNMQKSEDRVYSKKMLVEDFLLGVALSEGEDRHYSFKERFSGFMKSDSAGAKLGALSGIIFAGINSKTAFSNKMEKVKLQKKIDSLEKEFVGGMNVNQYTKYQTLLKFMKPGKKTLGTIEAHYNKIKKDFSKEQRKSIEFIIRLYAEKKKLKTPGFLSLVTKFASSAVLGASIGNKLQYGKL